MSAEPKIYVKPYSLGKNRGIAIPVFKELWFEVRRINKIPDHVPDEHVRIKRYYSKKSGAFMSDIRLITRIKDQWLTPADLKLKYELLERGIYGKKKQKQRKRQGKRKLKH